MIRRIDSGLAALAMGALAAGSIATFIGGEPSTVEVAADPLRVATYGNTVLAGSTALYAMHLRFRDEATGRAASLLAALGALLGIVAIAASHVPGAVPLARSHEAMAMLTSAAVFAYLVLERAYANRAAGLAVMVAVMAAVASEMWLVSQGFAIAGSASRFAAYWEAAHRIAGCIGFAPIAIAALGVAMGGRTAGASRAGAIRSLLGVGPPLLALAMGMGLAWCVVDPAAFGEAGIGIALGCAGLALCGTSGATT